MSQLTPLTGAGSWVAGAQSHLKRRTDWLAQQPTSQDDKIEMGMSQYREFVRSNELRESTDSRHLQEFLEAWEALALSRLTPDVEQAILSFTTGFSSGSIDLVEHFKTWAELSHLENMIVGTDERDPNTYISLAMRHPDRRIHSSPSGILEAISLKTAVNARTGFAVKRHDSALFFHFGESINPGSFASTGIRWPRGVTFHALRGASRDVTEQMHLGWQAQRIYTVFALHAIQAALFRIMDPTRFRSGDDVDVLAWDGCVRTFERIVELTFMIATEADADVRNELTISLLDLYEGLGLDRLPTLRWFERSRSWLPPDMRTVENARVAAIREKVIDEVLQGALVTRTSNGVVLPHGEALSKERYATRFLDAFRHSLTHGYHPRDRRQRKVTKAFINTHTGRYPGSLWQLAVPMLEALLGDVENWLRKFEGPSTA